MGPLSTKAKVQELAGQVKNQMTIIKTLSDEARKKDLHKLKMAKEITKAKAEGIPIDEDTIGASDGMLSIPKSGTVQPDTILKENPKGNEQPSHGVTIPPIGKSGPSVTLKNPEAGPSDVIPAMLTPGEAVIPASVAQDSAYKPVIEALVHEGRMRNRQPGGVKGFADGSTDVEYEPGNRASFEAYYRPFAEKTGKSLGVSPNIILAQLGHETGWGKKTVGAHNLGNIKDFSGQEGSVEAHDKLEGSKDKYRSYKNPQEFFDDYGSLLERKFPGVKGAGNDITKFVGGLTNAQRQKYATDPDYMKKLQALVGQPKPADGEIQSSAEAQRLMRQGTVVPPVSNGGFASISDAGSVMAMQNNLHGSRQQDRAPLERVELAKRVDAQVPALRNSISPAPSQPLGAEVAPPPSPKVPDGFIPKPVPMTGTTPEGEVGGTGIKVKDAAKTEFFNSTLEDTNIQAQLSKLQETPPPPNTDPKDWLSKGLAKIFGPTGMFNEEDLIRFSLLAAGGMLTGGSVGGSLSYAGLHTLKASDGRRAAQAQAAAKQAEITRQGQAAQAQAAAKQAEITRQGQVEAAKDLRERNQSLENTFYTHMDKASPEAKAQAQKLFDEARTATSPAMREAKMTQAIRTLAANQIATNDGKNRAPTSGYDSKTGQSVNYMWSKDDRLMVEDPATGNFIDARKAGVNPIPDSEYHKRTTEQKESISKRLTARLLQLNQKPEGGGPIDKTYTDSAIKEHAAGLTEEFMSLRADMGHDMKPEDFSKIVDNAISNISENYRGRKLNELTPEALRRTVYGSAVISMRPTNKALYEVEAADGKGTKPPGTEAISNYGNAVQKAILDGKAAGVTMSPADVSEKLEKTFKSLPEKLQKDYQIKARANPGYSPYLLWVADQYKSK